jgi:hypothetical protein
MSLSISILTAVPTLLTKILYVFLIYSKLLGFGLCPSSVILETRKHNVSDTRSLSEVSSFKGTQQQSTCLPSIRLRTQTDPLSETLCFLVSRTPNLVRKPSNSECYTLLSEPFRINFSYSLC